MKMQIKIAKVLVVALVSTLILLGTFDVAYKMGWTDRDKRGQTVIRVRMERPQSQPQSKPPQRRKTTKSYNQC